MIRYHEWYLPDGETHLQGWMDQMQQRRLGRLGYQLHKYEKALSFVPPDRRRVAVDVGAHVGLWSYFLAHDFRVVHAFEPKKEHRECWNINMMGLRGTASLYPCALGATHGFVALETSPASSGDTYVKTDAFRDHQLPASTGDEDADYQALVASLRTLPDPITQRTLDSFELPAVDFVKVDCEGYEIFVLEGARETLKAFRPVVIVEQKPGHGAKYGLGDTEAVTLLKDLGYVERAAVSGDYILTWGR